MDRKIKEIIKEMDKCRKQYTELEKKEIQAETLTEKSRIYIEKQNIFAKYYSLKKELEAIDPYNPELDKGIHNKQYTGI